MARGEGGLPARPVAIGVDYGTESGRVLLLDLATGAELGVVTVAYPHGVLDRELPGSRRPLGLDWALQDPRDYLHVLDAGVPAALAEAAVDPARVVGIGVDTTSCTVLPAMADGTPLCAVEGWADRPHAWPKLWKHHAAQPFADRLNEVAAERGEAFLARYGGRISSEWYFPKLLQVFLEDRAAYEAMAVFLEATDWIVWRLTGRLARSASAAGYKALWSPREGLPSSAFFAAAFPGFTDPAAKLGTEFHALGTRAGFLEPATAARLHLPGRVAVAVGNVDSFASVPGSGVVDDGVFVSVVGTSICDMMLHPAEVLVPGITGVVEDGILPGTYGYESGQAAVGDMFAWCVERLLGAGADRAARYVALEGEAGLLRPGESGLVALDWWNGNRSVLGDAGLSGVLAGLTLQSTPAHVYRALLESVAFGARMITDTFAGHGLAIDRMVACGGIAERSELLMQLFADVTGCEVEVPDSTQVPARGAALFAAVAADEGGTRVGAIREAAVRLRPAAARVYKPTAAHRSAYEELFSLYRALHDTLGREQVDLLHRLKALRHGGGLAERPGAVSAGTGA